MQLICVKKIVPKKKKIYYSSCVNCMLHYILYIYICMYDQEQYIGGALDCLHGLLYSGYEP